MQSAVVVYPGNRPPLTFSRENVEVLTDLNEARVKIGLEKSVGVRKSEDFRSQVVLQNHFAQRTMELGLSSGVVIDSEEKIKIIQSKITNNLMQWHSKWNLLIDAQNILALPNAEMMEHWQKMFNYLRKLFMLEVIAYGQKDLDQTLPCKVYRSRHRAVAELDSAVQMASDEAHCRSKGKS